MKTHTHTLATLGVLAAMSASTAVPLFGQLIPPPRGERDRTPVREIFRTPANVALPADLGPSVVEAAMIDVDFAKLDRLKREDRAQVRLLPQREFMLKVLKRNELSRSRYTFRGEIEGFQQAGFTAAVVDDALSMSIRIVDQGQFIMVRRVADGRHLVSVIDESRLDRCNRSLQDPEADGNAQANGEPDHQSPAAGEQNEDPQPLISCPFPDPIWDVVVVYTDEARVEAGGVSAIESLIHLFVEEANTTYENSLINGRMRMVYLGEVDYTHANDLEVDLSLLRTNFDGQMDEVHAIRNSYHADAVIGIMPAGPSCGLAYCCSGIANAFATSRWNCWGATFIHEFGHNQGCAHNEEDVDCSGCHSYSRGWYFTGNDGVQYGTIMSYVGKNFWHFSTPQVTWKGQPVGVANQADNVRTINNRALTVQGWYATHFDTWVDFGGSIFGVGTYANPFRHIADGVAFLIEGQNPSELPVMHIETGTTDETVTISKPMVLKACGGPVVIGQQ